MSANNPIIDVTPVAHSSERKTDAAPRANAASSSGQKAGAGYYTSPFGGSSSGNPFNAAGGAPAWSGTATAARSGGSVAGGLAQIVLGAGLVMIGVPMLILPGPGLLSIAGGLLLMSSGARKVFGRR